MKSRNPTTSTPGREGFNIRFVGRIKCKHCGQYYLVDVPVNVRYYNCSECHKDFIGTYRLYWSNYIASHAFDLKSCKLTAIINLEQ